MSRRNDDDWPEKTVMPTTNPETNEELDTELSNILNNVHLHGSDLKRGTGTPEAREAIKHLIAREVKAALRKQGDDLREVMDSVIKYTDKAARIDELKRIDFDPELLVWTIGEHREWAMTIEERITELQKEETDNE